MTYHEICHLPITDIITENSLQFVRCLKRLNGGICNIDSVPLWFQMNKQRFKIVEKKSPT